jgi:hemerythrin-like metal-binding protein
LVAYTLDHFEREERALKATDYPDFASHKREHEDLARQVKEIQQRFVSGSTFLITLDVMKFLKDWLGDHILGSDMKYSAHLKSKGIR